MQNNTILVATDFSEISINILQLASLFAKEYEYEIIIVHAIESKKTNLPLISTKKGNNNLYNEQSNKLHQVAKQYSEKHNVQISPYITTEKYYKAIPDIAKKNNSKYLFFGLKNEKTEKQQKEIILRLIKTAKKANARLVTSNSIIKNDSAKTMLLPIDNTDGSMQKVSKAVEIAKLFNAKIRLFSTISNEDEQQIRKLKIHIEQVEKFIRNNNNIPCNSLLTKVDNNKSIAELLTEYAHARNIDTIVIMISQSERNEKPEEVIMLSKKPVISIITESIGQLGSFQ